jgi:signal transduction histidine kinase
MRKHRQCSGHRSPSIPFFASVRVRLTLWYLVTITVILLFLAGSLFSLQWHFYNEALDNQIETQLYQDAQPVMNIYKQALLAEQPLTSQHFTLSTDEIVLLLRSDKTVLDRRGPLTTSTIQQLQARIDNSQAAFDMTMPQTQTASETHSWHWWWSRIGDYRFLIVPILQKDTRIAILMIGLPLQNQVFMPATLIPPVLLDLLISIIGGYWLAGRALHPVQMITQMANEINATDLRRRLHLKRRDEFGALAATFDQMLARLEAAFKRQTQFAADASHELRTPLTIIDLEVNRALTQLQTPEEYRQVLEQIQSENEHMSYIVNSLLTLARADTGQIVLHQEEVDLSDIALACVERLLALARQSQITISTGELPELLVSGDPQYLSRMLTNLIENAIKYTSGIGTHVHVDLACEHDQWGVIRVQDDGPGIAEEHLPFLFDRFYRVDKARSHNPKEPSETKPVREAPGGTGLGLAITQWIVQAHAGSIHVESKIGAGSLFAVRLPLLKQEKLQDDKSMTK